MSTAPDVLEEDHKRDDLSSYGHVRQKCDNDETDSVDEALMEMLGISSFDTVETAIDDNLLDHVQTNIVPLQHQSSLVSNNCNQYSFPIISKERISSMIQSNNLKEIYIDESICILPDDLSINAQSMRRLTDELVYGSSKYQSDRSYETIQFIKNGEIGCRHVLTRLENFVNNHPGWKELCYNHIASCISAIIGEDMVLFKEKLNLKPTGGSGFAPHLDTPSLRVALGDHGPKNFVTVMIAIDDMTIKNGCLRVCKGPWTEENHCEIIIPNENDSNPDAEGRRGAIPIHIADQQEYDDIIIKGGTIVAFNGWAPHRSIANTSPFSRRAVFLTYNPLHEGEFHDLYYQKMNGLRSSYRDRIANASGNTIDDTELAALATIPRI